MREVHEETGWECRIATPLKETRYTFFRGKTFVRKRVRWFRMQPLRETGEPDPKEILDTMWVTFDEARAHLHHGDDWPLLETARASAKESKRWG